mmetsp:Transcript_5114/g.14717  ORF Transcript_5114/g.14717 Transcript_5114/m.14717 type:complete len:219 (+) Transcript_5114:3685-4341(+)
MCKHSQPPLPWSRRQTPHLGHVPSRGHATPRPHGDPKSAPPHQTGARATSGDGCDQSRQAPHCFLLLLPARRQRGVMRPPGRRCTSTPRHRSRTCPIRGRSLGGGRDRIGVSTLRAQCVGHRLHLPRCCGGRLRERMTKRATTQSSRRHPPRCPLPLGSSARLSSNPRRNQPVRWRIPKGTRGTTPRRPQGRSKSTVRRPGPTTSSWPPSPELTARPS